MNVYLRIEDGLELVGHTSLEDHAGDGHVVDIPIAGAGEALRLTFDLRTVPCVTDDGQVGEERAILLSQGQTPDFLPGWQPLKDDGEPDSLIWPASPRRPGSSPRSRAGRPGA